MRIAAAIVLVVLIGALAVWCAWLTVDMRRAVELANRMQLQLWDLRHDLGQLGEGHIEMQERVAEIDELLTIPKQARLR